MFVLKKWYSVLKISINCDGLCDHCVFAVKQVQEVAARLKEAQQAPDSPEARATLPKLELSDIDPQNQELPIQVSHSESHGMDATLITHDLESSGILYADVAFDYSSIDLEDIELLPVSCAKPSHVLGSRLHAYQRLNYSNLGSECQKIAGLLT